MTTYKKITRRSKESARSAMDRHMAKMIEKGWKIGYECGGHCGLNYLYKTEFYK